MYNSTFNFCEDEYTVSSYISEFWNTISGTCLIISGLLYKYNNRFLDNKSFDNMTNILILIGVGTILFHGTLLYIFQLFDELPMILLASEYIILLSELKITKNCNIDIFYLNKLRFLVEYRYIFIICISNSYFINPNLEIILFHGILKLYEISICLLLYKILKNLNNIVYYEIYENEIKYKHRNKYDYEMKYRNKTANKCVSFDSLKNIQCNIKEYINIKSQLNITIKYSLIIYTISVSLWCLENLYCENLKKFQLHAIWHVLSSIGIYNLNNIMKYLYKINKNCMVLL